MRKLWILFMVILMVVSSAQTSRAYVYYDDILDHWGELYIDWATNDVRLFKGYENNTFKPENSITRAEFMAIINRLLVIQKRSTSKVNSNFKLKYSDLTKEFWAYEDIYKAIHYIENENMPKVDIQWVFPGNNFKPNEPITRYEAGVLISLITSPPVKPLNKKYTDLNSDMKFYKEILNLTGNGIVEGYEDGTFRPWNNITRAEASKIVKKAYEDLEYLKKDQLNINDLARFNLLKEKPLFEYGNRPRNQENFDKKFVDAIATLEYISFIGYIPHAERHLYDADPIGTLWQLKNDEYYNVIGVNYYLLSYDNSLLKERQRELVVEAMEYYETMENKENIKGMANFIYISKDKINAKDYISFLEKYLNLTLDNNDAIFIGTELVGQYMNNYQYKKALDLSQYILTLNKDIRLNAQLILNHGYIIYKDSGVNSAVQYLSKSWNNLKTNTSYRLYSEEIDLLFTSMMKQLMKK